MKLHLNKPVVEHHAAQLLHLCKYSSVCLLCHNHLIELHLANNCLISNRRPPGSVDYLLVDGNRVPTDLPAPAQVGGRSQLLLAAFLSRIHQHLIFTKPPIACRCKVLLACCAQQRISEHLCAGASDEAEHDVCGCSVCTQAVVKGDARVTCIAAASIIAKVHVWDVMPACR